MRSKLDKMLCALPTRGPWPAAAACTLRSRPRSQRHSIRALQAAAVRPGGGSIAASPPPPLAAFDGDWLWRQALVMGAASAILGPLCDGQHSLHDVLHYVSPSHLALGPLQLETCW